jgi:hypothetical protein
VRGRPRPIAVLYKLNGDCSDVLETLAFAEASRAEPIHALDRAERQPVDLHAFFWAPLIRGCDVEEKALPDPPLR